MTDQPSEWFWEGKVQSAVVDHLLREGWTIVSTADTATRQRGVDIVAVRTEERLAVEVKGYPTKTYSRGERAGTAKPTQPATQARMWFSHAVLSALLLVSDDGYTRVALAFPDFTTFRSLAGRTQKALDRLGVIIYLVGEDGSVESLPAEADSNRDWPSGG